MSLLLQILTGLCAAFGMTGIYVHHATNPQAALAWFLFAALATIGFCFEAALARRRAQVAQAARIVMAHREAIRGVAHDLVSASALIAGAAETASEISEALA
jgi:hypothetical protein